MSQAAYEALMRVRRKIAVRRLPILRLGIRWFRLTAWGIGEVEPTGKHERQMLARGSRREGPVWP